MKSTSRTIKVRVERYTDDFAFLKAAVGLKKCDCCPAGGATGELKESLKHRTALKTTGPADLVTLP